MNNLPILLKWPGGKRTLLKAILPHTPDAFQCYYEPFVGSGALFFALAPSTSILSDSNHELINCYIQIRDHPEAIIACLSNMKNTQEDYYKVRASEPTEYIERAARLIYLMTLSFNGIHRVNRQGKFNVPYNHKKHLNPCDKEKILKASIALSTAQLKYGDFEKITEQAKCGDFIYFDPPYTILQEPGRFVKYNEQIFSWEDQVRLAKTAHRLVNSGCYVLVSNADHPDVLQLYQDFHVQHISRFSAIAAKSKHRSKTTECLFYSELGGMIDVTESRISEQLAQDCKKQRRSVSYPNLHS
jgi:DNA adenine methylase